MRFRRIITPVLAFILSIVFMVSATAAGVRVTGELKHANQVGIGETYQGTIVLRNPTDTDQQVKIYQKDYLYNYKGENFYGEPGEDSRSNAEWISLGSQQLTLDPHEKRTITYTVDVPDDETLTGTYWSMIMVEGSPKSPSEKKSGASIIQNTRYAVRIDTNIGGTGTRKIRIIDSQLKKTDQGLSFQLNVKNTGERYLAPIVVLEVYDKKGETIGRFKTQKFSLHPGCSVGYLVSLPELESGNYPAMLYIDNLDQYVWGTQVELDVS